MWQGGVKCWKALSRRLAAPAASAVLHQLSSVVSQPTTGDLGQPWSRNEALCTS